MPLIAFVFAPSGFLTEKEHLVSHGESVNFRLRRRWLPGRNGKPRVGNTGHQTSLAIKAKMVRRTKPALTLSRIDDIFVIIGFVRIYPNGHCYHGKRARL